MDEIAIVTTLLFYLPVGLLTFLQVAEVGRPGPWQSASGDTSPTAENMVMNGNPRREAWVQTSRSCASLSLL